MCLLDPLCLTVACGGGPEATDASDMPDLTPQKRKTVRQALVQTLVEKKAYDSAVPLLNRALQEEPKNAQLYAFRATILRERGRLEEARKEFLKSIELDPRNPSSSWGSRRDTQPSRRTRKSIRSPPGGSPIGARQSSITQ